MSTVRRLTRARAATGDSGQRLLSDKSSYSGKIILPLIKKVQSVLPFSFLNEKATDLSEMINDLIP